MAAASTDHKDFYKMDASPKGICLIINNFEFNRARQLATGPADRENLTRTFRDLDFEVRYFENQTCAQMKTRMEYVQNEDHSNYDCFVCCISSHGNKTGVCGTDDYTVNISELREYVFSTQCPSLAGKPKVFFVDACRGGEGQKGHCLERSGAPVRRMVITDKRDFLLSFATTPDNVAYCNPDSTKGAVYFYHLTRLLEHYANSKTIMHILHKLNDALTVESPAHSLQTAQYESTLAKELRFYCPVQAMVRALQQELTQARSRVQVLELEVKRKDDQIKQNDKDSANQLQGEKARHQDTAKQLQDSKKTCSALDTELQGEKARHQNTAKQLTDCKKTCSALDKELQGEKVCHLNTAKQLTDCKKTCSALDKELQGEKARHQNTAKQLQDSKKTCSALEHDVASYQRQLREFSDKAPLRETSMTQPSRPTHPQTKAFRFHDNHGKEVVLSNNQQTAQYRGRIYGDGIVMSRDPMEVNTLYEVHITKRGRAGCALWVGVVTSSPDSLTLPYGAGGWESAVTVCSAGFSDHGDWYFQTNTDIGKALDDLPVDSRVGVSVDRSRNLHLHVNGADQGVVPCRPLPDPCWTLWVLGSDYTEVTTLPVTHVT